MNIENPYSRKENKDAYSQGFLKGYFAALSNLEKQFGETEQ